MTFSIGTYSKNVDPADKKTKLFLAWTLMMNRCLNPYYRSYGSYGKVGIAVVLRWHDFNNFKSDMQASYAPGMTLARHDVMADFECDNCYWSTCKQPNRLKIMITVGGERKSIYKWAEDIGVSALRIKRRLESGWTPEEAVAKRTDHA